MTASPPEFVYGPVTGLLQTSRDLYNLYSAIQEKKSETLIERKGNCQTDELLCRPIYTGYTR